jgi:hypothetical protein
VYFVAKFRLYDVCLGNAASRVTTLSVSIQFPESPMAIKRQKCNPLIQLRIRCKLRSSEGI